MSREPRHSIDWSRVNRFLVFAAVVVVATAVVACVYFSLLLPIGLSAFFTYLLLPFVERLSRGRIKRVWASLGLVAAGVAVLSLALTLIVPLLYKQALMLVRLVPVAFDTMMKSWLPLAEQWVTELGILKADDVHRVFVSFNILGRLEAQLEAGLSGLWYTGTSLAGGALNLVLVPFLTFFLLADHDRMVAAMHKLVPRDLLAPTQHVVARVSQTLRSVIKGQTMVAGILAVLYVIGLSVVGLQSAVAIGVVAGICRVIPYFDVIVGSILSTIVILSDFHGWGQVVSVTVVFLIVQALDGAIITPRVIGERVGLHPMVVVLSVLAFADWFGFWGVLLAIPVVAILKVLLESAAPYYMASKAYLPWSTREPPAENADAS